VIAATQPSSPFGILGVFLLLLGVGLILDADWIGPGSVVGLAGMCCFGIQRRRLVRSAWGEA
jgi:hypothetical protein